MQPRSSSLRSNTVATKTKIHVSRVAKRKRFTLPPPAPSPPPPPPHSEGIPYHRLPFELLDMIFRRAVAPSFLLDSSLIAGMKSPWCKARDMKLSLVLVSRDWHAAGIALLYEEVIFRRLNQIPSLLETLEKSPSIFGPLVKRIVFEAFIPSDYGVSFDKHIRRIIFLCPRVQGLAFPSSFPLPSNASLPRFKPTLKDLQVGAAVSPSQLHGLLLRSPRDNLISLSIHVHDPPKQFLTFKVLEFPNLESLTIQITRAGAESWDQFSRIFRMPKLRRLTFEFSDQNEGGESVFRWDSIVGPIASFCKRYESLKFLNVNPGFRRKAGDMQVLLDACPNLEHVVVYNGAKLTSHPTLKWVDMCTSRMFGPDDDSKLIHDSALNRLRESISRRTFPALQDVRHLHLCSPQFRDMATNIPPGSVTSSASAFKFDFPGVLLCHDHHSIYTERQIDVATTYDDDRFSLDDDYLPSFDPDAPYSDGTTTASEYSLGELRRREVERGDDDGFSTCSSSSECTVRPPPGDSCLFIDFKPLGR